MHHKGISLSEINFEELYKQHRDHAIVINDILGDDDIDIGTATEELNNIICSRFESDELDTIPTCKCGESHGMCNLGEICPNCNTEVIRAIERPFNYDIWMRVPEGIDAFIQVNIWIKLCKFFDTTTFSMVEYMVNPSYRPNRAIKDNIRKAIDTQLTSIHGFERSLNYFIRNFDHLMHVMLTSDFLRYKYNKRGERIQAIEDFKKYLHMYRDCIFTRYLPVVSRRLVVTELGGTMSFIDRVLTEILDAPKTLLSILVAPIRPTERTIQTKTIDIIKKLATFFSAYVAKNCSPKAAIFRRQAGSTQSMYSGRSTVTPIYESHEYDEVHAPWCWSVTLLRTHILSKLLKLGYSSREALRIHDMASANYHQVISDIIDELIAESPEKGIPIAILRNPTLERLSDQIFYITKVHKNPRDYGLRISVLVIKGPNCDFDGDQLQCLLLLDADMIRDFKYLSSSKGIMSTEKAGDVAGIITMHSEPVATINNALRSV